MSVQDIFNDFRELIKPNILWELKIPMWMVAESSKVHAKTRKALKARKLEGVHDPKHGSTQKQN